MDWTHNLKTVEKRMYKPEMTTDELIIDWPMTGMVTAIYWFVNHHYYAGGFCLFISLAMAAMQSEEDAKRAKSAASKGRADEL